MESQNYFDLHFSEEMSLHVNIQTPTIVARETVLC